MKKLYFILFFFVSFLSVKNVNAQANVTATGISIQGIASDENNSTVSNVNIKSHKTFVLPGGV